MEGSYGNQKFRVPPSKRWPTRTGHREGKMKENEGPGGYNRAAVRLDRAKFIGSESPRLLPYYHWHYDRILNYAPAQYNVPVPNTSQTPNCSQVEATLIEGIKVARMHGKISPTLWRRSLFTWYGVSGLRSSPFLRLVRFTRLVGRHECAIIFSFSRSSSVSLRSPHEVRSRTATFSISRSRSPPPYPLNDREWRVSASE